MSSRGSAFACLVLAGLATACAAPAPDTAGSAPAEENSTAAAMDPVDRGRYLVTLGGCYDCHSPKTMTPEGPVPADTNVLSGHPATETLPAVPAGVLAPDRWGMMGNNGFTAFVGPWGTSFARNLTPDVATGLGSWTEDMFMRTIREGRHQGEGRPLLPPMPWQMYRNMTDEDLRAVFAYLRSIPAVNNPVPDPVPPQGAPAQ